MRLRSILTLLLVILVPIVVSTASAITDTSPPIWPSGSTIKALSITTSSISITWTQATDDSGVVNYKVYVNGIWGGMYQMSNSFGIQGLSPNTTVTFLVVAVDPSSNWSVGPSATFTTSPLQCAGYLACLVYMFKNDATSFQGGRVKVNDTVTNEGQVSIRIASMTVSSDLGYYSLMTGTELLLGVGERATKMLTLPIPFNESLGAHSLVFMISWRYNSTSGWTQGPDIVQTSTFSVTSLPLVNQPLPFPVIDPAFVSRLIKTLWGNAYYFALPYLAVVSLAAIAVVRDERRKRAALLKP